MSLTRLSTLALGYGSLFFAAWGLTDPRGLARMMGDDPAIAPALGMRDGLIGLALLRIDGPGPLLARCAADVSDAVRLRDRSPKVALGAAGFALLAAATAIAAASERSANTADDIG